MSVSHRISLICVDWLDGLSFLAFSECSYGHVQEAVSEAAGDFMATNKANTETKAGSEADPLAVLRAKLEEVKVRC